MANMIHFMLHSMFGRRVLWPPWKHPPPSPLNSALTTSQWCCLVQVVSQLHPSTEGWGCPRCTSISHFFCIFLSLSPVGAHLRTRSSCSCDPCCRRSSRVWVPPPLSLPQLVWSHCMVSTTSTPLQWVQGPASSMANKFSGYACLWWDLLGA